MQIDLTKSKIAAVLEAIGQQTGGNAYDFKEWSMSTSGTRAEWEALRRAEKKLEEAAKVAR